MKYLLDTNVCVGFLNQRKPLLTQRFLSIPTSDKVICSIVRAELFYGAHKSQRQVSSLQVIENFLAGYPNMDFDIAAARFQGEIRADLERKGTPIGPYDIQIAAIALANNLTLVAHNTDEFSRIPHLTLDDWE
jgi:tRNA(fMet)-specific endonuclease VapC